MNAMMRMLSALLCFLLGRRALIEQSDALFDLANDSLDRARARAGNDPDRQRLLEAHRDALMRMMTLETPAPGANEDATSAALPLAQPETRLSEVSG